MAGLGSGVDSLRPFMDGDPIFDRISRGPRSARTPAFVTAREITPKLFGLLVSAIDEGVDRLATHRPQTAFVSRFQPTRDLLGGRLYNVDRLHFEWGSIIGRGNLSGRSKHRRRRDRGVSRFATGESESSGCLIEHPRLTSGSIAGGGADGPAHGSPSARSARFVRGDKTWSPASDRGVRPSRAADDASHECKAEAQRHSDLANKSEDHDGGGR